MKHKQVPLMSFRFSCFLNVSSGARTTDPGGSMGHPFSAPARPWIASTHRHHVDP